MQWTPIFHVSIQDVIAHSDAKTAGLNITIFAIALFLLTLNLTQPTSFILDSIPSSMVMTFFTTWNALR